MKKAGSFLKIALFTFLLFSTSSLFAQSDDFETGEWQIIVDGQPGEGGLFYRLDFDDSGSVKVLKQAGGTDDKVELKAWDKVGDKIFVHSSPADEITEFDGGVLTVRNAELVYENGPYKSVGRPYDNTKAYLHWILILLVLIAMNEIFRRYKWAAVFFFIALPILLTPLVWSHQGVTYWFKWAKVYSVIFAVIWFLAMRYSDFYKHNWVKIVAALFLAINIAEAVSQDFSMGFLPNVLNGIAGLLSMVTLFYGWRKMAPSKDKHKDLIWPGMTILWIVAYDVWNIVYVYLNFPGSASAQLMVLLSCTIPALFIKKGTWLQARAFTLAAWFMYYFTFPRFTEQLELHVPRTNHLMLAVAVLSIGLNVICFVLFILNQRKSVSEEKTNLQINR